MSQPRTPSQICAKPAALSGLLALALSGCAGFTPMYAAQGVSAKLSAIEVAPTDGRAGFLVKTFMDNSLARDQDQPAIYRLSLANREVRVARGITIANVASRYEVDLITSYTLTEIATGKQITRGSVGVNVTYDLVSQPYAALSAEQDGERRAAEQAADRVRLELATFFASPRPNPSDAALKTPDSSTYSFDHRGHPVAAPAGHRPDDLRQRPDRRVRPGSPGRHHAGRPRDAGVQPV